MAPTREEKKIRTFQQTQETVVCGKGHANRVTRAQIMEHETLLCSRCHEVLAIDQDKFRRLWFLPQKNRLQEKLAQNRARNAERAKVRVVPVSEEPKR